ncbi:NAD(P)/FAD-dependent oxidoreductase [Mammaliicoccus sp. Dog046]|uniref:dihydrolipoyl dehydrogenase family protein n=1 Tax=Mammaliicoccus sp. Dog046 TaxID=3034233 RepID=UPI002B25F7F3|nr:NAD(P)/FAD-dependent oxidoreductase [Mammaliicoccus sp. Dog046]WQK85646.1 NAD(P)/FAD-dependent oxidoreductase [Mammaliicoccus sp. Dog046]
MEKFDVIFLGSGHAAWHAALTLQSAGQSVAIIEKDTIAGTCTNYGCNAKILLEGPYEILEEASHYPGIVESDQLKVNWNELMNYKKEVLTPLPNMLQSRFEQQGITVIKGMGQFVDKHTIRVNNQLIEANHIVIATGQHSNKLNITGSELTKDSRDFLSLEEMPHSITFIGAGIISIEFASIAIKSGAEVHVIHHNEQPLAEFNERHIQKLVEKLQSEGVQFHLNEQTEAVVQTDNRYQVKTASGLTIDTDYVLDATGRKPNVHNIGLDELGIAYSDKGIQVDNHLRTNVPHIYASGDVLDKDIPKLTPTATFESNYIAGQILGINEDAIQYPAIPTVLYSLPRLSQIGITTKQAQDNDQYTVKDIPFGKLMLFEFKNEIDAEMSIVLDSNKHLVGAEIYANDAANLINLVTFIVNQQMTAQDLNQLVFAFPGSSSGVLDMLKVAMM